MSKFQLLIIWNWLVDVMTWIKWNFELVCKISLTSVLILMVLGAVFLALENLLGIVFMCLAMLCIILFAIMAIWTV